MATTPRIHERGSVLLTSVALLAVLTVIGIAAISLSTQERKNAAAKVQLDALQACASAAQAKIWAEMSQYGLASLAGAVTVSAMNLPGGLTAMPGHYGSQNATSLTLNDVTLTETTDNGTLGEQDCTNRACGTNSLGHIQRGFAHCIDRSGREFEVEIAIKFAL